MYKYEAKIMNSEKITVNYIVQLQSRSGLGLITVCKF